MRDHDEDTKKPQPVKQFKKGSNQPELAESGPWRMTRNDADGDLHRHVV